MKINNIFKKDSVFLFRDNEGFTLIEVLVSIAIFVIIFTLGIVNYRQGEHSDIFRLQAFSIEDSIRNVQNMSLTGREIEGIIPNAYGIFLNGVDDNIIIYGDINGNNIFENGIDLIYSTEFLEEDIEFNLHSLNCYTVLNSMDLDIVFTPPEPTVLINNNFTCDSVDISISNDNLDGDWHIYFNAISGITETEFIN